MKLFVFEIGATHGYCRQSAVVMAETLEDAAELLAADRTVRTKSDVPAHQMSHAEEQELSDPSVGFDYGYHRAQEGPTQLVVETDNPVVYTVGVDG